MSVRQGGAIVAVSAILVVSSHHVSAQCETAKLVPADAETGDGFGELIGISDGTLVIGSQREDELGTDAGAAYVFRRTSEGAWLQTAKLMASDGSGSDNFGFGIAIWDDIVAVGARNDDDQGSGSGSVYVFEAAVSGWVETAKVTAPSGSANDRFGYSIGLFEGWMAVGAPGGSTSPGSVHVFRRTREGEWRWVAELVPSEAMSNDEIGFRVALEGDTLLVGAPRHDALGADSGAVWVYGMQSGEWIKTAKLTASDGAAGDTFGRTISISSDTVLVGANFDDDAGSNSGSAYVFERLSPTLWLETNKLTASDGSAGDNFGVSVSIAGGLAVIGADKEDASGIDAGAAYIFERGPSGWKQVAKVIASDASNGDEFGFPVRIAGTRFAVGARLDDPAGGSSGSAYAFSLPTNAQELTACPLQFSLAAGGVQSLDIDAGANHALDVYWVLGSASGTTPGLAIDSALLPLNFDRYLLLTLSEPNTPMFANTLGILDSAGKASASVSLEAGLAPTLAGLVLHHAFVLIDFPSGAEVIHASDATALTLLP